jgi:hypothetical protein
MNTDLIEANYNIILQADLNKNLLTSTKNGHFKEVDFGERIWRGLKNLVTRHAFDDCKAIVVAQAIANFAQTNDFYLNNDQKVQLIAKVNELEKRYMRRKTVQVEDFTQAKQKIISTLFFGVVRFQAFIKLNPTFRGLSRICV